ncbi:hypothetical protein Dsin_003347 [Dipteronia sinensis]|uniref:Mitochondrial glycoprotein n=1 Tax=Dipteronia sinensis TaxID=43782 RepID=A0AAE0B7F3_9ROSI|nr:hypothetical protein Dsin_032754 [Dipteronia sinensis]KAK3231403.1 hypothetical protein Dsin_003284 [Dipteronia sinensis]KAK3231466.1 hypothetical protein Dsin_003347 [Dipteronia sinensis]
MAFTAILRKSASSLAPFASRLARFNRSHHSAIFTASSHLSRKPTTSTSTSSSFVPIFRFSSAVEAKKPSSDESLIQVIDSEIKCVVETDDQNRVEETPSGFPFKIEDIPGQQTVILTREHQGDHVKVEVGMPDLVTGEHPEANNDDDDDDSEKPNQASLPLVVTITKNCGTSLEFSCTGYPDEISIDSLSIRKSETSEDEIPYEGPDFHDLDENLKKAFHKYLEVRGIKPATTNFLFEFMLNKDTREYTTWLKNIKSFIEA